MMNNEAIVSSIKQLCKDNNITVTQLEKEVGLSQGLVSKWKDKTPSLDKIIDIADYFHVTIDEVVGRNQIVEDYENDIIIPLMQMTTNKEIEWEFISDYDSKKIKEQSYDEIFGLFSGDEIEIYKCNFYDSAIFLIAQYDLEQEVVENLNIQIYIQPDSDSLPVIQDINENWIQEFWVGVRKPFKGVPDEWKADVIRKRITGQPIVGIFGLQEYGKIPNNSSNETFNENGNNASNKNSEIQDAIKFLSSKEFRDIQKILSNKELMNSIIYLANSRNPENNKRAGD